MTPKRPMKVLLINPTFTLYKHGWAPLGLGYLAASLKQAGHEVRVYDPTPNNPKPVLIPADFRPDLVGISVVSPLRASSRLLAERIKKETGIPIVVGGPDVTSCWPDHMSQPCIDYAVVGEGEQTLVELADALAAGEALDGIPGLVHRQDGTPVCNPPRELAKDPDVFPIPARELLDMAWYRTSVTIRGSRYSGSTLMSARGCPYNCLFCDSRRIWTRKYRPHSIDRVVEEISHLIRDYRTANFQFLDDTFTVNKRRTLELCERFAKDLRGIHWACQVRVDTLDDELLEAMKAGGCIQVEFGVESGSDSVLKTLRKGFTVDQVRETFDLCRRHEMRTYANFIIGTPHETEADVRATFDLHREIRPNCSDLWVATPYPGTDLHAYCVENGLLKEDYVVELLHHGAELGSQLFMESDLKQEDIDRLHEQFYEEVRKDWDYDDA